MFFIYFLFYVSVWIGAHVCHGVLLLEIKRRVERAESLLFTHHVSPGDLTPVLKLDNRHLHPLSHPPTPAKITYNECAETA